MKKVINTSEYWGLIDYDVAYYRIVWDTEDAQRHLESNSLSFITEYVRLAYRYGMLVPSNIKNLDNLELQISRLIGDSADSFPTDWTKFGFNRLYKFQGGALSYCALLTERSNGKSIENIVNANSLITFEQVVGDKDGKLKPFAEPVTIEFFKNYLVVTFHSDALLFDFQNKKTGYETFDNSSTALNNATRFNSFLRALRTLCLAYKSSDFESEIFSESFVENGIPWKDEVLFYEDVVALIPDGDRYISPV